MGNCLHLTKSGEYALAALSCLALEPQDRPVSIKELAEKQRISPTFLAKIMSACGKAGLVHSKPGASGGVMLSRPAESITLLAIIEACEGPYQRENCVFFSARKCEGPDCEVYCSLRESEGKVRERLASTNLAHMAEALRAHPWREPFPQRTQ
jgi:Rrf2 family protein